MDPKERAIWFRTFTKALKTPDAARCGLAAMADTIKLLGPCQKRTAWAALAKQFHQHGFSPSQYDVSQEMTRSQTSGAERRFVPKCAMLGICGGPGGFAEGLATGDIEEMVDPATGRNVYAYTIFSERDLTSSAKRIRAGNAEAQAVLDSLTVGGGYKSTGRTVLPGLSMAAPAAPPPLAVEDANAETKLKLVLDQCRVKADKDMHTCNQTLLRMGADTNLSNAQKSMMTLLDSAMAQCEESAARVKEECAKWTIRKMGAEDQDAVRKLIEKTKAHLDNGLKFNRAAESLRNKKALQP